MSAVNTLLMATSIGNAVMDVEVKLPDKRRPNNVRFHQLPIRCQPISVILWKLCLCRQNRAWGWALSLPSCPARALETVIAR